MQLIETWSSLNAEQFLRGIHFVRCRPAVTGWSPAHLHTMSSWILTGNEVGVEEWSLKSVQLLEMVSSKVLHGSQEEVGGAERLLSCNPGMREKSKKCSRDSFEGWASRKQGHCLKGCIIWKCSIQLSELLLSDCFNSNDLSLVSPDLFGLMGPIIGMSPDKKTEIPGMQEERTGLRGVCGVGTLPEAECASSPLATSVDRSSGAEDEELTNLNWLHENLLQNFTLGGPEAQTSGSPLFDIEGDYKQNQGPSSSSSSLSQNRGRERDSLKSKPPFSFSLLIYMAIEQSPSKSLPVKEIYGWILEHFPYFSNAPTGWKNSVRHNLSLNKCFRKVDKSLGKVGQEGVPSDFRRL